MKTSNVFLIIGPNGAGKSTILSFLKSSLSSDFNIHDFDERGVPNNADKIWRQSEIQYWFELSKTNLANNLSTVICGFMKPKELKESSSKIGLQTKVCFLDVDKENLKKRLLARYATKESLAELMRTTGKSIEKFIGDNIYITSLLKTDSESSNFKIIDTSNLNPSQTAEKVLSWIKESQSF